jgi:hypothetical protein
MSESTLLPAVAACCTLHAICLRSDALRQHTWTRKSREAPLQQNQSTKKKRLMFSIKYNGSRVGKLEVGCSSVRILVRVQTSKQTSRAESEDTQVTILFFA